MSAHRTTRRPSPTSPVAGVGLTSMRERATELGGRFTISRAPGGGTLIRAELPIPGDR